jgi:(p)ppGpp synthase/HD superfamily hydrolase
MGPRFSDALVFANEVHGAQSRKGTSIPYIAHLLAVASLVIEAGGDEDTAIAALLHDAVEDQGGAPMLDRIRKRFGPAVAEIVEACSDADVVPKPPWRERKEAYVRSIAHKSAPALLVSLADKVHNARAILADYRQLGDALWPRFTGGRDGTLWYYRALADAFRGRAPSALWATLDETVSELEGLAGISARLTRPGN